MTREEFLEMKRAQYRNRTPEQREKYLAASRKRRKETAATDRVKSRLRYRELPEDKKLEYRLKCRVSSLNYRRSLSPEDKARMNLKRIARRNEERLARVKYLVKLRRDSPEKYKEMSGRWRENRKSKIGWITEHKIRLVYRRNLLKYGELTCELCLSLIGNVRSNLDHGVPVSRGGDNSYYNLLVSHWYCNLSKATMTLEEYRAYKKLQEGLNNV